MSANGYDLVVCSCEGGPHLGARKAGTPCCCEACGFITADQLTAVSEALGSSGGGDVRLVDLAERIEAAAVEVEANNPNASMGVKALLAEGYLRSAEMVRATPGRSAPS